MLRYDDEEPSASLHSRDLTTWEPIGETWRPTRVVSAGTTESWGTSRTRSWRRKRWFVGGREDRR